MPKNLYSDEEQTLEELMQSILEEEPGMCIKCGHKMIQQYKTEWSGLSTEIKMRCHHCGHTAVDEKKLLS